MVTEFIYGDEETSETRTGFNWAGVSRNRVKRRRRKQKKKKKQKRGFESLGGGAEYRFKIFTKPQF